MDAKFWKGKSTKFTDYYGKAGMFEDKSMTKAKLDLKKIKLQKEKIKRLIDQQNQSEMIQELKIKQIREDRELLGVSRVNTASLLHLEPEEIKVAMKEIEMVKKTQTAAYIIQAGWKMHQANEFYRKEQLKAINKVVYIQRAWRAIYRNL
jgi:hypothetical protein